MTQTSGVDYYATLNLPPHADLTGVENAYTRLSDQLMRLGGGSEDSRISFDELNEAYAVLSHPRQRREYDLVRFSRDISDIQRHRAWRDRRHRALQRAIVGVLGVGAIVQSLLLVTIARDDLVQATRSAFG